MPPVAERNDPYLGTRFFVEIDGIQHAGFSECSGLQVETEVTEYVEGGNNAFVHKLPGRSKFSNVTLKWGTTDSHGLWDWYQAVVRGQVERKDISVVLYNSVHEEVRRWNLREAWPAKWIGSPFSASSAQPSIETLELAHHGFEVE
jgi:phage tail-like protein